jgi:hypothetical protein
LVSLDASVLAQELQTRGMAIDDPLEAFRKTHTQEPPYLPSQLTTLVVKMALPGFVTTLLDAVCGRLSADAQGKRYNETLEFLLAELSNLGSATATKSDLNDLKEALQLAIRHDVAEFNDKKRERYIKIIGNAIRSEASVGDLASFIQDIEQLGERDFTALRVLNTVMNKPTDWGSQLKGSVHPNTFIQRRQELAVQIAGAFGIKTTVGPAGQTFSHEEGYEACTRLQGFGLAHEIDVAHRQVPGGDYCFRPSKRGLMLLKLTGEQVNNWEHYFPGPD